MGNQYEPSVEWRKRSFRLVRTAEDHVFGLQFSTLVEAEEILYNGKVLTTWLDLKGWQIMKRTLFCLSTLILFLAACASPPPHPIPTTTPISPTKTPTPSPTPTFTATPTPTITPTPMPKLPVGFNEDIPKVSETISINNADQLRMLANYERFNPAKIMVKVSPDGEYFFVVTSAGIDIYHTQSSELFLHHDIYLRLDYDDRDVSEGYSPNDIQISADSSRFMARVSDEDIVIFALDGEEVYTYNTPEDLSVVATGAGISPDGKQLAVDNCSGCNSYERGPGFKMANIDTGEVTYIKVLGRDPMFSPDGEVLVTRDRNQVLLWDTSNWKLITSFPGTHLVFSEDMTYVASLEPRQVRGSYKPGRVIVWRMEDRKQMQEFIFHCGDESPQAIFSPK